jgi:hypothetical protein
VMRPSPWLALALLMLAASEAGAQHFQRTAVPGRAMCLVWNTREYVYRVDAAGSLRTPGTTEFDAIDAAFAAWRTVSATCSDYTFTRGPDIERPKVGYVRESKENENVITFREVDCDRVVSPGDACHDSGDCSNTYACWDHGAGTIGLTTTTFSFRTGYILDADIEFNASEARGFLFTTISSPPCRDGNVSTGCVATDLQNTLTHEVGHVAGLDHVASVGSTMEPTAPPGETHKRILDMGSAAGFCEAYPRGLPPTQCGESDSLLREFLTVGRGPGMGCGAAPGALLSGALLGLLGLLRGRWRA